ncbi:hypothetical protein V8B97DRAFT_1878211 [Scleroderma yunnanense]
MSSTPTCLTHSDTMIWDNPGQMSEDSSFHTAGSHISPMQSVHAQFMDRSDATKSTSNALSATSEGTASFSHTPLTHQNTVMWDNNSGQMSEDPSLLIAVDCSSMHSIYDGHPAAPLDIQCVSSSLSSVLSVQCLPLSPHVPPGLKESIQNVICHHVQTYSCLLDASLYNQIELGLSEAFKFTLNLIE